jgi:hypothetical protein
MHQDCSMQWMRRAQIVEWNFVSSFCTCMMEENLFSYFTDSSDETTLKPSGVLGNKKCRFNKKNEDSLPGVSVWCGLCPRGLMGVICVWCKCCRSCSLLSAAGQHCVFHQLLALEARVTIKVMVHHLVITLTRKYSRCSFSRKIKKHKGRAQCPPWAPALTPLEC